jgi:hypothetical protein
VLALLHEGVEGLEDVANFNGPVGAAGGWDVTLRHCNKQPERVVAAVGQRRHDIAGDRDQETLRHDGAHAVVGGVGGVGDALKNSEEGANWDVHPLGNLNDAANYKDLARRELADSVT